jgi:hypothetical protein
MLIGGAVKQLQNMVEHAGNLLRAIPGMGVFASLIKLFIEISLGYVDECCLGYTFYNEEQNVFKSAADGVVIYYQNWKKLLRNAAMTALTVIIAFVIVAVVLFFLFLALFKLIIPDMAVLLALIFAGFLSYVIKYAFIDSWILVRTMVTYMTLAPATEITYDLYGKLCGFSGKFKDLFAKGLQMDGPSVSYANMPSDMTKQRPAQQQRQQQPKPVFCSECGTKNKSGTKFCESCGYKIG